VLAEILTPEGGMGASRAPRTFEVSIAREKMSLVPVSSCGVAAGSGVLPPREDVVPMPPEAASAARGSGVGVEMRGIPLSWSAMPVDRRSGVSSCCCFGESIS
jgi:hypothetical protein